MLRLFDCAHLPIDVPRGIRYIGPEPTGTLLTLVGRPVADASSALDAPSRSV
jgi:hypothetical protein